MNLTLLFFFFSIASIIERYKLEQIVEGFTLGKPVLRVGTGLLFYPRSMKLREYPGDVFFFVETFFCAKKHQAISIHNAD